MAVLFSLASTILEEGVMSAVLEGVLSLLALSGSVTSKKQSTQKTGAGGRANVPCVGDAEGSVGRAHPEHCANPFYLSVWVPLFFMGISFC